MPGAPVQERGEHGRAAYQVLVLLAHGVKTSVEGIPHRFYLVDTDAGRQMRIEGRLPVIRAHAALCRNISMETLGVRMHAGIRATTGSNTERVFQNTRHGCFNRILHRFPTPLALPAAVGISIIGTGEKKTRHSYILLKQTPQLSSAENCGGIIKT